MKAIILCGGRGRRLDESTEYIPKPLIEISDRPILWHVMKIYAHQGIKDFILCLGYKGNEIKDYFLRLEEMSNDFILDLKKNKTYHLSDNDELDVTITFVDTGENTMTGARIARVKKYIGDDEDFFVTYADGLAEINLKELFEHHKKIGKAVTLTTVHPDYRFGLVELNDGVIKTFDEKPRMKDFINGGFMVFNKKAFDYLSENENCILEQEPLRNLTKDGQLAGYIHKGFWKAMDTQKDLDELKKIHEIGAPWEIWKRADWIDKKDCLKNMNGTCLQKTSVNKDFIDINEKKDVDRLNQFNNI